MAGREAIGLQAGGQPPGRQVGEARVLCGRRGLARPRPTRCSCLRVEEGAKRVRPRQLAGEARLQADSVGARGGARGVTARRRRGRRRVHAPDRNPWGECRGTHRILDEASRGRQAAIKLGKRGAIWRSSRAFQRINAGGLDARFGALDEQPHLLAAPPLGRRDFVHEEDRRWLEELRRGRVAVAAERGTAAGLRADGRSAGRRCAQHDAIGLVCGGPLLGQQQHTQRALGGCSRGAQRGIRRYSEGARRVLGGCSEGARRVTCSGISTYSARKTGGERPA